jgi:hypothetical protein
MRALKMLGGAVVLAAALTPALKAQDAADVRRLTILTFSAPVQLPGMTLPAGKYRFEMADINNAAHTVRVSSEDGQKVFGTFSTIPTTMPTRDLRNTDTIVMWAERPAGQPQAAKEWYYPQRSIGEEFVYPKAQASAIAAANHASVASEDNGKISRVEPNANEGNAPLTQSSASSTSAPAASENRQAQNTTAAPAPAPAAPQRSTAPAPAPSSSAVGTSGQSTPAPAPAPAAISTRQLPRTASQLGLFGLLSGLSLAAAFGVRRLRAHAAARG